MALSGPTIVELKCPLSSTYLTFPAKRGRSLVTRNRALRAEIVGCCLRLTSIADLPKSSRKRRPTRATPQRIGAY